LRPSAVEYLAKDETKVETFTFNVEDGQGGSVERTVSVTVTGTNDVPVVEATDVTGAVTELVTATGNLTDSGSIAFTDVDLTDVHSVGTVTASSGALGSPDAPASPLAPTTQPVLAVWSPGTTQLRPLGRGIPGQGRDQGRDLHLQR
jgi:hypothetical protein